MSTVNKVSDARKRKEEPNNHSYPFNLASIPYASFMRIYKYSYDEGMKNVGANQNDAIGSIQNSGLLKNINEKLVDGAQWIYGDKTSGRSLLNFETDREIIDNYRTQMENNKVIHKDMQLKESALLDMKFDVDNGWGAGHSETTLRELMDKKNEVSKFHDSGYKKAFCNLAMPNEFQYDYSANWNNTFKLGTMALAADDPQRAAMVLGAGGALGGISNLAIKNLGNANEATAFITEGAKDGVAKAGDLFGVNSNILDPTNIVGMAGLAPNENAIQFFKKMEFRSFEFTFELAARSDTESRQIQEILTWFKMGMHPVSKNVDGGGSGVLLGFPDVWRLEPRFTPGNAVGEKYEPGTDRPHPMMPQTKLCALTAMGVNTTPMGQFSTVFDGTIPLVTVRLKFNELTALTRADFMTNKYL